MGNGNSNTHTQYESQEILFAPFFFIEYYELHTHFLLVVGSLVYSAFSIDFFVSFLLEFCRYKLFKFFFLLRICYIFFLTIYLHGILFFSFSHSRAQNEMANGLSAVSEYEVTRNLIKALSK